MHPDASTVLEFYFLEQAIPDMQRELPAYLAAAEGELEWWLTRAHHSKIVINVTAE